MIRLAAGYLARSRHASVRSLERYARPGPEAVARHLAATGPRSTPGARQPGNQHGQPQLIVGFALEATGRR